MSTAILCTVGGQPLLLTLTVGQGLTAASKQLGQQQDLPQILLFCKYKQAALCIQDPVHLPLLHTSCALASKQCSIALGGFN
jgi:hypothetical protein